jgi:hypothetical protein
VAWKQPNRPYNIVSNEPAPARPLADGSVPAFDGAHTLYASQESYLRSTAATAVGQTGALSPAARETKLRDAAVRYWKSRNFDPLAQSYLDPVKELEARAAEDRAAAHLSQRHLRCMPPPQRDRALAVPDIITGAVCDEEAMGRTMQGMRASRYRNVGGLYRQLQADRDETEMLVDQRRLAARVARSFEQHLNRDWDLISNQHKGFDWTVQTDAVLSAVAVSGRPVDSSAAAVLGREGTVLHHQALHLLAETTVGSGATRRQPRGGGQEDGASLSLRKSMNGRGSGEGDNGWWSNTIAPAATPLRTTSAALASTTSQQRVTVASPTPGTIGRPTAFERVLSEASSA